MPSRTDTAGHRPTMQGFLLLRHRALGVSGGSGGGGGLTPLDVYFFFA